MKTPFRILQVFLSCLFAIAICILLIACSSKTDRAQAPTTTDNERRYNVENESLPLSETADADPAHARVRGTVTPGQPKPTTPGEMGWRDEHSAFKTADATKFNQSGGQDADTTERDTGKISFGAGISSDAGILSERAQQSGQAQGQVVDKNWGVGNKIIQEENRGQAGAPQVEVVDKLAMTNGRAAGANDQWGMMPQRPQPLQTVAPVPQPEQEVRPEASREGYSRIVENEYVLPVNAPLSTFSIDVDTAAYANMRRFVSQGMLPPADAIRTEELINYFTYDYNEPAGDHPISIFTEVAACPWQPEHRILHIGMQGKNIKTTELPPSNIVFLLDVSGSMNQPNKLPLLQKSMKMLTDNLRPEDRVAIVVYAGAAGMVLPSTSGDQKHAIVSAIDRLRAGGSTAGAAGIEMAYKTASEAFIEGGNNRVILATDGDFNVGTSSDGELERLIEKKRESGVFLTVLGFGTGNYQDAKMQTLADKGNGNHAYIDNILEAKKVLVNEFGSTLFAIAKDVKLQIEFNPQTVKAYRLIGYENRMLAAEDFNDDKKDAGEIGAGHSVTALYEIVPHGAETNVRGVDPRRYQNGVQPKEVFAQKPDEFGIVKVRYKLPDEDVSTKFEHVVNIADNLEVAGSHNLKWSAAVAEFSLLLRDSKFKGNASYEQVIDLAKQSVGYDEEGYRAEFIGLVKRVAALDDRHTTDPQLSRAE